MEEVSRSFSNLPAGPQATMDPSISNVVMMRMIEYLQEELNASQRRAERAENIAEAQQEVIHSLQQDLRLYQHTTQRLNDGAAIVCRAMDEMYQKSKNMFLGNNMAIDDWNDFYRLMMRGDVGFAILNGADLIDLTADTELDQDSDETESERGDE